MIGNEQTETSFKDCQKARVKKQVKATCYLVMVTAHEYIYKGFFQKLTNGAYKLTKCVKKFHQIAKKRFRTKLFFFGCIVFLGMYTEL